MATPNGTPDNQANAINGTPETQTKPTKNQLGELKDSVKKGVLPLITGAILAHGVSATDLKANPIDVQDKPGITQVVDSSKQERNQLKTELEDKVTEKEILDYYIDKKGGDKVIAKYNSLQDSYKSRVLDYYKHLDGKPMKSVSALITVFNNVQLGLKFVDKYDKTGEVGDMPQTIESALVFLLDFDPNGKNMFTKEELGMFEVVDKTVLGLIENEITEGKKTIIKSNEQLKFLKEFRKSLSAIN